MPASPAFLASLRAAMSPQPVAEPIPLARPDNADPLLNPQPLPPGYPDDVPLEPVAVTDAAPHPMLDFSVDYDALSKDRNDEVMANNNAIDQANNAVLAQQKEAAVQAKSDSIIADDQHRRAELRQRLIMSGQKNPDQEVARLMGPVPAAAMADKVHEAVATGDSGVHATPRGVESGLAVGAANLSRGDPVPKRETTTGATPGEGTIGYVPKSAPANDTEAMPPLDLHGLAGGHGGGGPAGPSKPITLSPDTEAAYQASLAAHDDLTRAEVEANQARTIGHAQLGQLAGQQAEQLKVRAEKADAEAKRIQDGIEEQSRKLADVKVDPNRYWNNANTGQRMFYVLAAAIGGVSQSLNHLATNPIIDQANRIIDQDIDAQKHAIESGRQKLGDMKTGLAEFYRRTGNMDQAVALTQAKAYEQQAHQIDEYLAGTNDKILQARGSAARAEFMGRHAAALDAAVAADQAAKAKAAAAGGSNDLKKLAEYTVKFMSEGHPPEEAKRMAAYAMQLVDESAVKGIVGKKEGDAKYEEKVRERQIANDEANRQFGDMMKSPILDAIGMDTALLARLPAQMAPESNEIATGVDALNLEFQGAVAKVLKDNEGRIPPTTLHKAEKLEIKPGMTKRQALAQIQAAQEVVNSISRQGGTTAPKPNQGGTTPTTFKK